MVTDPDPRPHEGRRLGAQQSMARCARRHPSGELIAALEPFATDFAATLALVRTLPPTGARRMLENTQDRHARLLGETLTAAAWLSDDGARR